MSDQINNDLNEIKDYNFINTLKSNNFFNNYDYEKEIFPNCANYDMNNDELNLVSLNPILLRKNFQAPENVYK